MPRLTPDITISLRTEGKRKQQIIQVFKSKINKNQIRIKINNKWFKNKLEFPLKNLESLIFNTIEKQLVE